MSHDLFQPGGIDSLVVYGPMSHALTDFLDTVPVDIPMIRIYGKTPPPARELAWDTNSLEDLGGCLSRLQSSRPQPRIAFIGSGFMNQNRLLIQETKESVDFQIEANVSNYVHMTHALLPLMVRARFGRFVYLSSFRTQVATRGISIYSASKAFGEAFFRSVGIEYGSFGVTSVSIRMGYFPGGLLSGVTAEGLTELKRQTALGRLGTPHDLSQAISYALKSEFTNGGVIELEGGLSF
jgi:3-oxoacyl-[acyl-carrier protein] reductase